MCCAFELSMCLFGLVVLVRGHFELSGGKIVSGVPACMIGVLLAATGPLVASVAVAGWYLALRAPQLLAQFQTLFAIADWLIVGGILLIASIFALLTAAKPELPPAEATRRIAGAALEVPPAPDDL